MINSQNRWNEFMEWIERHSEGWIFRGVPNKSFLLIPSVGRIKDYSMKQELAIFEHFKLKAKLYKDGKDDYEWLAIAQHHGLKTRLLDWTENPLIAAYFACVDKNSNRRVGRIYAVNVPCNGYLKKENCDSPFKICRNIEFVYSPVNTRRIELQKGLFSIHPIPDEPVIIVKNRGLIEIHSFFEKVEYPYKYVKLKSLVDTPDKFSETYYKLEENKDLIFEISPKDKPLFEKNIRLLGIDENIFGDIDSIAKYLNAICDTLPQITDLSFEFLKRRVADMLVNNLRDYINSNTSNLLNISDADQAKIPDKLINGISIDISEIKFENNKYKIKGTCHYYMSPNYWNKKEICSELDQKDIEEFELINKQYKILNIANLLIEQERKNEFEMETISLGCNLGEWKITQLNRDIEDVLLLDSLNKYKSLKLELDS